MAFYNGYGHFAVPLNFTNWYEACGFKKIYFLTEAGFILCCYGFQFYMVSVHHKLSEDVALVTENTKESVWEKLRRHKVEAYRPYSVRWLKLIKQRQKQIQEEVQDQEQKLSLHVNET